MDNLNGWDHFYSSYPRMDPIACMMSGFNNDIQSSDALARTDGGIEAGQSPSGIVEEFITNEVFKSRSLTAESGAISVSSGDYMGLDILAGNRSNTHTFSSSSSPISLSDQNVYSPVFCDVDHSSNELSSSFKQRSKYFSLSEDNKTHSMGETACDSIFKDVAKCLVVSEPIKRSYKNESHLLKDESSSFLVNEPEDVVDKDHELEVLNILMKVRESAAVYSRKVFIGGVPDGMSATELSNFFSCFGEVRVDWPHRKHSDDYPKGYAFLIFATAESVPLLIRNCLCFQGRLCIQMEDSSFRSRTVQVRPWKNQDRLWKDENVDNISARYSIFLGGVPRTTTAGQLASLINGYIGNVVMVNVEVDMETEYPKGAARIVFSQRESYLTAIAKRHISILSSDSQKEMEMKPFLEENMTCENCNQMQTRNFCAELRCLLYICDKCWPIIHALKTTHEHKPMQKGSFFPKNSSFDEYRRIPRTTSSSTSTRENNYYDEKRDVFNAYGYRESSTFNSHQVANLVDNPFRIEPEDTDYSRKVFVGGLPEGLSADEITDFFSAFGHLSVDWPHRERSPHVPRAGYAFLVFANVDSVRRLVNRCSSTPGKLCLKMTSPKSYVDKMVQIRPWCKSDRFWSTGKLRGNERYSVFMGGVPRTSTAAELASLLYEEIGEVLSVSIEVESTTDYPKGAAKAVFSNREMYVTAIRLGQITVTSVDQQKTVELKPYLEESMVCERCHQADTRNFCADLECLLYLCEFCWELSHSSPYSACHKPMLKGAFFPSRQSMLTTDEYNNYFDARLEWEQPHNRDMKVSWQLNDARSGEYYEKEWPRRGNFYGNSKRMMI